MKKTIILLTLFLMLVSCNNNEALDGTDKNVGTSLEFPNIEFDELERQVIYIGRNAGVSDVNVVSNTTWTIEIKNSFQMYANDYVNYITPVDGLKVSPLAGINNATITLKYDSIITRNNPASSRPDATLNFYYYSYGIEECKTIYISRENKKIKPQ